MGSDDKGIAKRDTKVFLTCTFAIVKRSDTMSIYGTILFERGTNGME